MTTTPASSMASAQQGNGSRPTPNRTLRQPFTLDVADLESKASSSSGGGSGSSDQATLRKTLNRKVELQRKTERWMDLLMEETVDRSTFKKASIYIQTHHYLEILHERHLNSHCSYPSCPNPPYRPFNSSRRISISTTKRQINQVEGNPEDGYCCKQCRVRSGWVEKGLERNQEPIWLRSNLKGKGKSGRDVGVELMEDLEDRGEVVWDGKERVRIVRAEETESPETQSKNVILDREEFSSSATQPPVTVVPVDTQTPPDVALVPPPHAIPPTSKVADLIANLTIYERPTPVAPPTPPTLTPIRPAPSLSYPEHIAPPSPSPSPQVRITPQSHRVPASSMISTSTTRLASTLITASKSLSGAVNSASQLGAESSEGEENWEEEWEKEMGWGDEGDEEFKRLFEEARLARELLDQSL